MYIDIKDNVSFIELLNGFKEPKLYQQNDWSIKIVERYPDEHEVIVPKSIPEWRQYSYFDSSEYYKD